MASGGKREGAGRKPASLEEKRVTMSVVVSRETAEALKSAGMSPGRLIDELVSKAKEGE